MTVALASPAAAEELADGGVEAPARARARGHGGRVGTRGAHGGRAADERGGRHAGRDAGEPRVGREPDDPPRERLDRLGRARALGVKLPEENALLAASCRRTRALRAQ